MNTPVSRFITWVVQISGKNVDVNVIAGTHSEAEGEIKMLPTALRIRLC